MTSEAIGPTSDDWKAVVTSGRKELCIYWLGCDDATVSPQPLRSRCMMGAVR